MCVPLTDRSQGQPKDTRAKRSSAIAAGKHTPNSLTLMDYGIFTQITQTYVHTYTHTHHTSTSVAADRNTDGHGLATSVSPSLNPCETDSNPSTGHTHSAVIPQNKLTQSSFLKVWEWPHTLDTHLVHITAATLHPLYVNPKKAPSEIKRRQVGEHV